jgi:hypothetical protein
MLPVATKDIVFDPGRQWLLAAHTWQDKFRHIGGRLVEEVGCIRPHIRCGKADYPQ